MAITASGSRQKPAGGFELRSWIFMRVSGVLLVGLALGHLWIMHVIHGVDHIDYDFVSRRLAGPFSIWRWYDLLLLGLAMLHGLNGVRVLIDEYVHAPGWRTMLLRLLYVGGGLILLLGSAVLLMFTPRVA